MHRTPHHPFLRDDAETKNVVQILVQAILRGEG